MFYIIIPIILLVIFSKKEKPFEKFSNSNIPSPSFKLPKRDYKFDHLTKVKNKNYQN